MFRQHIAPKYDLLNHTLSMSIDRIWRRRGGAHRAAAAVSTGYLT